MKCTEWHHRCRSCGHRFILPGADLSFLHGAFLGVSSTPEASLLEAFGDSVYAEIASLVADDRRSAGLAPGQQGRLVRSVIGQVFDPDSRGSAFDFTGTHPCPQCASVQVDCRETAIPWPGTVNPATHHQWDSLSPEARAAAVKGVLGTLLS